VSQVQTDILHCIGGTSLVRLRNIVPRDGTRVLLKLEGENPTGSMKDRMALAMIDAAKADGRLPAGGPVVEYTTGNTGMALALVCAVRAHPLHIVTSDAFAQEKLDHMQILGATLHVLQSEGGRQTARLTRDMVEAARVIRDETGAFWTNQLSNTDQVAGYQTMGEEIWRQTDGHIDAFVQSIGSAGSILGTADALRSHNPEIRVIAVEPSESAVLSGGPSGGHRIDGIGAGFVVPLWRDNVADQIERVSTEEAMTMALRLAREEGIFAGPSTGANVSAALRVAERLGPRTTVVTVMCDSGMKYLKTYGARLTRGVALSSQVA
jgi:cysteine synthase